MLGDIFHLFGSHVDEDVADPETDGRRISEINQSCSRDRLCGGRGFVLILYPDNSMISVNVTSHWGYPLEGWAGHLLFGQMSSSSLALCKL